MAQSIFNSNNVPQHTWFSDQHTHERTNAFKGNENCVGLKLANTLAPGV